MPDRNGFNERLLEAMREMVNPTKESVATVPTKGGGKYTYKYETLDQVLAIVRPALMRNGLGLTQYVRDGFLCTAVFDVSEIRVMDERQVPNTSDPQAFGSWETYMRRYSLRSVFGLCGEDDDGAAAKGASEQRQGRVPEARTLRGAQGARDRRRHQARGHLVLDAQQVPLQEAPGPGRIAAPGGGGVHRDPHSGQGEVGCRTCGMT